MKPGQIVVCIERDEKARVNTSYGERIFKDKDYVIDWTGKCDCGFCQDVLYVRVSSMKTKWEASSFIKLDDWNNAQYMVNELVETTLIPVEL